MLSMSIDFKSFQQKDIKNKCSQGETTERIQPWAQGSSKLPFILLNPKNSPKLPLSQKRNSKIISLSHEKEKSIGFKRHGSLNSFSLAKQKKYSKYESDGYKQKTIRNVDIFNDEGGLKNRVKKKLSKQNVIGKIAKTQALPQLRIQNISHEEVNSRTRAEKRIEIERKIFMIMSKDRI